jgi:hypothetical protein
MADDRLWWADFPKFVLLSALYSLQSGFFAIVFVAFPVLYKKHLSYSELGVIMMCSVPFSIKMLWSPIVEFYFWSSFGQRKSWIVPTQLVMFITLMLFKDQIEPLVEAKEVNLITGILTFVIFVITCQDIAVDAWAVEILHKENTEYSSFCQTVGVKVGGLVTGTVFISMASEDFCIQWFGASSALWTISGVVEGYCWYLLAITTYVALFVPEGQKNKRVQSEDSLQEGEATINQTLEIFKDVFKNKQVRTFFSFIFVMKLGTAVYEKTGRVYLTSDLGYDATNLSTIKVIFSPVSIWICGRLAPRVKSNPFAHLFYLALAQLLVTSWFVFVVLGTFPENKEE